MTVSASDALQRLREGNQRFVSGIRGTASLVSPTRRAKLATAQHPFAIVLGCSDSRVPAELIFDQGLGELFVVRVAGNVATPTQVGSVEFAATHFGTSLVVVLGHTRCGAIQAAVADVRTPAPTSPNVRSIIDSIRPTAEAVVVGSDGDDDQLVREVGRANVRAGVARLRHESEVLSRLVESGQLDVVGAEYSLETGVVEFFEARDDA